MANLEGAISLASKARKLIYGVPAVCDALKNKTKIYLIIVPNDMSEATDKKITDKATFYNATLYKSSLDGETLAHIVGKTGKISAVAVTDSNFYELIKKNI